MSPQLATNDCWNQVGVAGDRSCPELKTVIHCHNCPVYSAAGRSLLEREPPSGYLDEWTDLLKSEKDRDIEIDRQLISTARISVVLFRLGGEWLALSAQLFKEVMPMSVIHTLPHRSNNIFMGLVNIRGEIQICISLKAFLELETVDITRERISPVIYERLVVVDKQGSRWVFPVDEIYGIHYLPPDELRNVPATVSKVPDTYTKGVINWQQQSASYLDDELLFYALDKKVL
jgi:chemotaxis-related protein WspD